MKGLRDFADPMCESLQSFVAREPARATGTPASPRSPPTSLRCCCCRAAAQSRTLTHGDALHLVANARSLLPLRVGDERLALLPMCHLMERVLGLYLSLDARVISNYLENPDTAIENLQEVQPTVLATDPQHLAIAARPHRQCRRRRHAVCSACCIAGRSPRARAAVPRRCWRASACCTRSGGNSV